MCFSAQDLRRGFDYLDTEAKLETILKEINFTFSVKYPYLIRFFLEQINKSFASDAYSIYEIALRQSNSKLRRKVYKKLKMLTLLKNSLFVIQPAMALIKIRDGISANKISYNKKKNKCHVLGNGPSLKKDLEIILNEKENADHICVNAFPLTDSFFDLKPGILVLTDTAFFRGDPNPEDEELRGKIFETVNMVNWPLQIIVSHNADLNFLSKQFSNKNIELVKMKAIGIHRPLNENAFRYYDTGLFAPPFTNVLVAALFCAIKAGYDEIEIFGADFSYMFLIDVDQKSNEVIIKEEHFYKTGEKEVLKVSAAADAPPTTMYEFLDVQAKTFRSHELLNEYAKRKGISMSNRSSYSAIDAYPRG